MNSPVNDVDSGTVTITFGGQKSLRVWIASIAIVVAGLFWWKIPLENRVWEAAIAFSILGVFVVVVLLFVTTSVDPDRRALVREWRFLGKILVWRSQHLWASYRSVTMQFYGERDDDRGFWIVALNKKSGGRFDVQYFNVDHREETAEPTRLAEELSRLTGLPFDVEEVC